MTKRLLIHIGYHKTATTWMQQLLFLPVHGYGQVARHEEAFDHVVKPHGFWFDPSILRGHLDRETAKLPAGTVPVFSSEILSGHPFFGGIDSDIYAQRLKAIVPDARILISIRSQLKILPSVYMQYLRRGGTMHHRQFFEGDAGLGFFGFRPDHFEYDRLIGYYRDLFGAGNVHVMTQESLRDDMGGACAALARFCGAEGYTGLDASARRVQSASYPEHAVPFLRRANHLRRSVLNPSPILALGETRLGPYRLAGGLSQRWPLEPLMRGKKPVTDYVNKTFTGHFTQSNERLKAMIGDTVDLSAYR